jgi:hypothetical protein
MDRGREDAEIHSIDFLGRTSPNSILDVPIF